MTTSGSQLRVGGMMPAKFQLNRARRSHVTLAEEEEEEERRNGQTRVNPETRPPRLKAVEGGFKNTIFDTPCT